MDDFVEITLVHISLSFTVHLGGGLWGLLSVPFLDAQSHLACLETYPHLKPGIFYATRSTIGSSFIVSIFYES